MLLLRGLAGLRPAGEVAGAADYFGIKRTKFSDGGERPRSHSFILRTAVK